MSSTLRALADAISSVFKWWVIIAPWEQGLRIRGGKRVKLMGAGVHFRIPFWDRVYVQPTRLRIETCQEQTLTTADGKVIALQTFLAFRVSDLLLLYEHVHEASATAQAITMQAVSSFVESNPSEIVTADRLSEVATEIVSVMLHEFGLDDVRVTVANFVYIPKTYRLITGGVDGWVGGSTVQMGDETDLGGLR